MLAFQGTENRRKDFPAHPGYSSLTTKSDSGEKTLLTHHWDTSTSESDFGEEKSHYGNTVSFFTHSWGSPSTTQSDSSEKTSHLDRLLSSLSIVEVPGDGSCLFWSAGLAYLLSIAENKLEEECAKLFGNNCDINLVKKKIESIKLSKLSKIKGGDSFSSLIRKNFREQVVNYIRKTLPVNKVIEGNSLSDHLKNMLKPETFGSTEEVEAISGLLDCKISVINSWDKKLEYIGRFGTGSTHLYLFLEDEHYSFGLQKESVQEGGKKLFTSQASKHEEGNNNFKQANSSNNIEGIVWAKKLKNVFNSHSNKPPDYAKANGSASPPLQKQAAEEEQCIWRGIIEQIRQLRLLEVAEIGELSILEEIERLEEETEENNKINMLAPLQLLHPLNVLKPFSRLKKLTEWLKEKEPSKRKILEKKKRKKLKEEEEIYKQIVLLRKLIEREEEALFLIKKKIKQSEWAKIEKQLAELNDEIECRIVVQNKDIKYQIAKQNEEKKKFFILLNKEREEQASLLNKERENATNNYEMLENAEAILKGIGDLTSKLNDRKESPISMLKEKFFLQRAYLGLREPVLSDSRLSKASLDENFLYLEKKWKERDERVRYFAELPFTAGFPDEVSEVTGLINKSFDSVSFCLEQTSEHINNIIINKIAPTINPYSNQLAKKIIELEQWFFKTFCFGGKFPEREFSVEVTWDSEPK